MPWPRPRRALCVVCLASCESVVSSFSVGLGSRAAAAANGGHVRGGANGNLSMTGLQDGGGSRKGVPTVQATAEVDQQPEITAPIALGERERARLEDGLNAGIVPEPPSGPPIPEKPTLPSIEDGVKMELGKYKGEPFEAGSFPPNYLYALQRLRSEEDESFGAAFISLRAAKDRAPTRTWNVGRPNATSVMALARFKIWWMMPKHSTKASEIPPETQMMLTKLAPDPETGRQLYAIFIPLIDGQAKCTLKGLPDGSLQLFAETGCPKTPVPSSDVAGLYVGVHEDPFKLIEKSYKLVNARLRNQVKAGSFGAGGLVPALVHDAEKQLSRWKKSEVISKAVDQTSPDFSQYLGWCTWDSFYTSVDHEKVFKGLESLRNEGINPKWLVLDDGWQSTSNVDASNGEQWMDHLTSLWANEKFRDAKTGTDLSRTVEKARKEFGINYFMVWHAIAGYWAGVDLDSPDLMKYKPRRATLNAPPGVVEVDPDMKMFFRVSKFLNKRFGVVPPEKIRAFYEDYHRYLRSQGVDGVKVDAQSVVNFLGPGNGGSVMLSRAFHSALSKSVRRHFPDTAGDKGEGGRIIHCMCHDSEILLQLPACYGRQPVIRGSDDFYPRDKASHSPHIYANAFNGLMISNCGLQDWDMFQTGIGDASWMHAASRAVSGGPVYISDRPGEHNVEILRRMVLEDGSVMKPPSNALPCLKSLFVDPQRDPDGLLSIWNDCEAAGHGIVAIFNIYGSAWSQGRRAYAPVRTPSGALSVIDTNGNGDSGSGDAPAAGVFGSVSASDCHRLLRDSMADGSSVNGAEPRYAMFFHFADRLVLGRLHHEHELQLTRGKSEVASISKITTFKSPAGEVDFASIGLADMFNAGGAIVSEQLLPRASASSSLAPGNAEVAGAELMVKGSGRFLAHCSLRPNAVFFDGKPVEFTHGEKDDTGVSFLETVLPQGFTGVPRRLILQWGDEPAKEGAGVGLHSAGKSAKRRR